MNKDECGIMIVDDSDFSRNQISRIVDELGYRVVGEASHAKEAIKLVSLKKPKIVIIDVIMPEISGIELAESITENFKDVRLILISSLAQDNIIIDAIGAGANDFIQKPITPQILENSLEKQRESFSSTDG
ncbi:response regulator [Bacteriovoracaceae bacterium]|nr:response regulator [Bacteriovoracaceae bacterium]